MGIGEVDDVGLGEMGDVFDADEEIKFIEINDNQNFYMNTSNADSSLANNNSSFTTTLNTKSDPFGSPTRFKGNAVEKDDDDLIPWSDIKHLSTIQEDEVIDLDSSPENDESDKQIISTPDHNGIKNSISSKKRNGKSGKNPKSSAKKKKEPKEPEDIFQPGPIPTGYGATVSRARFKFRMSCREKILDAARLIYNPDLAKTTSGKDGVKAKIWKLPHKKFDVAPMLRAIDNAKKMNLPPDLAYRKNSDYFFVYSYYLKRMELLNCMDFTDILWNAKELLQSDKKIKETVCGLWKYLIIDEFQDTAKIQMEILEQIFDWKKVTAVGDDDQLIMTFAGSDSNTFDFYRECTSSRLNEINLVQNYRSTQKILNVGDLMLGKTDSKPLNAGSSWAGSKKKVVLWKLQDAENQAHKIADEIENILKESKQSAK